MSRSLKGRVALVTGSSTGLGQSIARQLGECGARVAHNYFHNEERAQAAIDAYRAAGLEGVMLRGDVAEAEGVRELAARVEAELGPIDILVVNATPDQPQLPIEQYSWEHYETMIDFFIKSPYLLTRACLPHMKEQGWGRIINIGSEVFARAIGNFSAYVTAKGGQTGFTRSMATELAPFGITVNMVCPGWIPVERHEDDPQSVKDGYLAQVPMRRWGVPADVAHAVAYFASEEAGFVSGQNLSVNGALTTQA